MRDDVLILGAGIGGLTFALELHRAGIPCRVYEAAPEIAPVGVGINVLPHASAILAELDLEAALTDVAVTTREQAFFNRFGQLIYREPAGRAAGHATPQFSIHRGDLQAVLCQAALERIGADRLYLGWRCRGVRQRGHGVQALFDSSADGSPLEPQAGAAVVAFLDARVLARELSRGSDTVAALRAYEAVRRPATAAVVMANRAAPPDAILREVYVRTGDQPFQDIDDVISQSELRRITEAYRQVSGSAP